MAGVSHPESWQARHCRWMNGIHARIATMAKPAAAFTSQPEPRTIGSFAKGRQLIGGNFLFAGYLVEAPGRSIWDLPMPSPAFEEELHGFAWLDDLAAVGDGPARIRAQGWTADWIARHGRGRGAGWSPDLTGRRLIRWINHALFLLNGQKKVGSDAYFRSLAQQTIFLSRRWKTAAPGLPRFEALTGLIYAGLALEGMERHVAPAAKALARECREQIDAEGGIPTRNPEELLEVFTLLTWAASALSGAGMMTPKDQFEAIERIAPTLRALRHADGGLARFHGGGRGAEGRLDQALAAAGVRAVAAAGRAMGYARLSAGRTSVIVDAGPPPAESASVNAHASTLAMELTSGRRPLVVSCGSGASFGAEWRRAGRATQSHSTLAIEGCSSARLKARAGLGRRMTEVLVDGPREVGLERHSGPDGISLVAWHDGYVRSHGLTHARRLELSADGRQLGGEDTLGVFSDAHRKTFDKAMDRAKLQGIAYALRFHLHPDVDAAIDMGGAAVSLALKSGEIWVFRHDGHAELRVEPSVYLEKGRLKPRATRQILLSSRVLDTATQINWTLAKAQDTPQGVRDLVQDDDGPLSE
ncbi:MULTISPECIES: heparinase II/III family protein [Actibacterium]|uniref:Putative heparinase superfamily protein n=1 Tax=Actibacterium naphthalenivorans TaxID=1614693 RepID=A0A840CEZ1_9RHOB|nr:MULTISPECIES: heparinase II/III family protein [Actibacterium]ALG91539.1 heparinase [Actibacterium sp. EMB200-NS6]MBB4021849.1 putative heparinase superfamily protein [Actibacterium naphthalenivorans]